MEITGTGFGKSGCMGSKLKTFAANAETALDRQFTEFISSFVPEWTELTVNKWREKLQNYLTDEDESLTEEEWATLTESLMSFHHGVLKRYGEDGCEGIQSLPSHKYAAKAIEAIQAFKQARSGIAETFDDIFFDDCDAEAERTLKKIVDDVVLSVEGGRPFERVPIDWVDPVTDRTFTEEMYNFVSAGREDLPQADIIDWLPPPSNRPPKLLPKDLIKRLTTPQKIGELEDHEDWEYSATHPVEQEEEYARFVSTYDIYRNGLREVLTEEIHKHSEVDTTAAIDPAVVQVAAKQLEEGKLDVDFKSLFVIPYDTNNCKLIGVRDSGAGHLISYKEVLKPPKERINDSELRSEPSYWADPDRPAGPQVRSYGWEPLATNDESNGNSEIVSKKRWNPDALSVGTTMSDAEKERARKFMETIRDQTVTRLMNLEKADVADPVLAEYLETSGIKFGLIPESFKSPEDLLTSLDLEKFREKDSGRPFPMENETVALEPGWANLSGDGHHEQLTEELYWKELQSLKKPSSTGLVDWKAILEQEANEGCPENEEVKENLAKAIEALEKNKVDETKTTEKVELKEEKASQAKKRALDKEFVNEWVQRYGSEDGLLSKEGRAALQFKPPGHLVTAEEYKEKYFTHPHTSSHVFHPNFVRFRRMTRSHPTYAEYAFQKLEPVSSIDREANLSEFKAILTQLERCGPQVKPSDGLQRLNQKSLDENVSVRSEWDAEFNNVMDHGMAELESLAEGSRSKCKRPSEPCKEEPEGLLFEQVDRPKASGPRTFRCRPFALEDFDSLPNYDPQLPETKPAPKAGTDDSDDEELLEPQTIAWRPFKTYSTYKNANVLQLLFNASEMLEPVVQTKPHLPPKLLQWIEGKHQPSVERLKRWRKRYKTLFPGVVSPMSTPYLFMSENQRLRRLDQLEDEFEESSEEMEADEDIPPGATEEEAVVQSPLPTLNRLNELEELSGLVQKPNKVEEWAEVLDTREAPDMSVLGTPAMEFPFQLDNFQKQAIMALEQGYNVFVSAHTSAGKTTVAEYALAMSRKRRSRAIYTSPVKALSNQKYNDFKKCFDSVGLITGDVQLNETADCLVMTTEILRSMLFNASEGIENLEFVVLDEVHYMNDRERGHVWEEVLILLPASVQIVMLSATVPNTMEFASWVGRLKQRKVMVCKTLHRPVPLKHYFYIDVSRLKRPDLSEGQFLLKDGDNPLMKAQWENVRRFIDQIVQIEKNEKRALRRRVADKMEKEGKKFVKLKEQEDEDERLEQFHQRDRGTGPNQQQMLSYYMKKEKAQWFKFINYLREIEWLPTIIFAFSRKKCDQLATSMGALDLTDPSEKSCIDAFFKSQIAKLDQQDQNLPQILSLKSHLRRGIGVHHSGVLPVLKEIVEFLFQQGKVKLLIATETFAVGVNMPARTVVFFSVRKFDGDGQRFLLPTEYIQMAGRAGRRGEDTVGNVIITSQTRDAAEMSIENLEAMMSGAPHTLKSQFRMSYRVILCTITARSQISAETMMAQSYYENKMQLELFKNKKALRTIEDNEAKQKKRVFAKFEIDLVERFRLLYRAVESFLKARLRLRAAQSLTNRFQKEVGVGKFVKFCHGQVVNKVGIVVMVVPNPLTYQLLALRDSHSLLLEESAEIVPLDVTRWFKFLSVLPPPNRAKNANKDLDMVLIPYRVALDDIIEVYKDGIEMTNERAFAISNSARMTQIGGKSKCDSELETIGLKLHSTNSLKVLQEQQLAKEVAPELFDDLLSSETALREAVARVYDPAKRADFIEAFASVYKWISIADSKLKYDQMVSEKTMLLYPEYESKMEILREMNYVVEESVQMKGYMAARISKFELVVTETLLRNVLTNLTPEEVAGLLSFLVFQPRTTPQKDNEDEDEYDPLHHLPNLKKAIEDVKAIIKELKEREQDHSVFSDEMVNLENAFELVPIMYAWAKQKTFAYITQMNDSYQEGMLVRWIQQLVEALKEIVSAAKVMGNPDVPDKIQASIKSIKRGIVFSPSLYTTM